MNVTQLKESYDNDGFCVVRGFLPPDELAQLTSNLDRYIREVVPNLADGDAFYEDKARPETLKQMHRIEQDPFFAEYLKNPRWLNLAESLLGEPAWAMSSEWFNKPPKTNHVTPPHQDNFYFCFNPPQVLSMWLALDKVDDENGCLRYVGGSHRPGIRPHARTKTLGFSQGITDYSDADRALEVPMHAQPGDVLIHHANTIHRADANRSAMRHRRSFAMVYRTASCKRDDTAFQRYTKAASQQHQEMGLKT